MKIEHAWQWGAGGFCAKVTGREGRGQVEVVCGRPQEEHTLEQEPRGRAGHEIGCTLLTCVKGCAKGGAAPSAAALGMPNPLLQDLPYAGPAPLGKPVSDLFGLAAREAQPTTVDEGRKDDAQKPMWNLLPFKALAQVVGVLTYGARKYAPENWRKVANPRERYFAAALRHLVAWKGGEKIDPESGLSHLGHALCCLLFLCDLDT
jgi:hypothetical protein